MKKLTALFLTLMMLLSLTACGGNQRAEAPETTAALAAPAPEAAVLGEGATVFTCVVVDLEGSETPFEIHTDETTVGAALLALGLIAGDEGDYGLYINTVNGITADWDADMTYWAFYVNGEYAMSGVDYTEIDTNAEYSLVLTKG